MKGKLYILTLLFVTLFVSACKDEQGQVETAAVDINQAGDETNFGVKWNRWNPAIFAQAKEQKRLVFVYLSADWCPLCKKMDMSTWLDPQVIGSIEKNYIPIKVKDETDPVLAERYRTYGRPAVVILDANGVEIAKKTGYQEPLKMHWMLEGVAQNPTAEANI